MSKLQERLWIWGQSEGSHHATGDNAYNLPGENKMDSRQGCEYLGLNKCCRVTMGIGPFPPFDDEMEKIKNLNEVVWSAIGSGSVKKHDNDQSDLNEVIRMAEKYPNVTGAVLDDFFSSVEFSGGKLARHSIESIKNMRERLHSFPKRKLDLWMVWYTYQLDFKVQEYIDLCDVITLWTWEGKDLPQLDKNMEKFLCKTPGKRRFWGCYMWNYGEHKPFTVDDMKFQCEKYYNWIREGWIEGIIFCSNCICDIGLDTVEWTREWIKEISDEEIYQEQKNQELTQFDTH